MYKEIKSCRLCGSSELVSVLNLGNQCLTGVFPAEKNEDVESIPLELVKCDTSKNKENCGLLQLKHTAQLEKMYGDNYGYRSGLNVSMVKHLQQKVKDIIQLAQPSREDLVIDIGSNDCTTLRAYPDDLKLNLLGVDPSALKFKEFYPPHIRLIPNFFSRENVEKVIGPTKGAKIITSIAMFYDLEDPLAFVRDIYQMLDDEGVWVFEQSYMPTMLDRLAYDTICHEHLEYYSLKQIQWALDKVGFKILSVDFNDINGGSFSVVAAKKGSQRIASSSLIKNILRAEENLGLDTLAPYEKFETRVKEHRLLLKEKLSDLKKKGKKVFGYGASTKGNVVLQYCDITTDELPFIAEVNVQKFGHFTPGSLIPIVSEKEAKDLSPDFFLVLPWHFRENIISREAQYIKQGGKLLFPLPEISVV